MNLIGRIVLPLAAMLVLTQTASGQTAVPETEESCSCACAYYLDEKGIPACQAQCSSGWKERQCADSAMPDMGEKDTETLRFEAEIRSRSQSMRYPMQENVIASQVYIFQASSPEYRQAIWEQLEKNKVQLAEQQQQEVADEADLNAMPTDELDAETLRYKAAVEQLNLPPGTVEDLVEMFQANDAAFRKTLWLQVEESPLKK